MTQEEKNIKIVEACGWMAIRELDDLYPDGSVAAGVWWQGVPPNNSESSGEQIIPDHFNDLNACHEMEEWIINARLSKWWQYCDILITLCPLDIGKDAAIHAKAKYRAEAFGLAMGLWREGE